MFKKKISLPKSTASFFGIKPKKLKNNHIDEILLHQTLNKKTLLLKLHDVQEFNKLNSIDIQKLVKRNDEKLETNLETIQILTGFTFLNVFLIFILK
jgi:SPX domain protein involved in polyphosphate accumulation